MDYSDLQLNNDLTKNTSSVIQPQGAVYAASNPSTPANAPSDYSQNAGAAEVITGAVITSCFIQTSALPSRTQLSGNAITFFDDTIAQNGQVVGDASRIVFTHASAYNGGNITSGFILEKRALSSNTYDNVLELFSPDNSPNTNFVFLGRNGIATENNISLIEIDADYRSAIGADDGYINGVIRMRTSQDGVFDDVKDGVYIMDRGTETTADAGSSVAWLVGAGAHGQVRLTYMTHRTDNPLTQDVYDIYVDSAGIRLFGLPTSAPSDSHALWNNGGVINIGTGGSGGGKIVATLTGTPSSGATSITFASALSGLPAAGYYLVAFNGSGEVRSIFLSNGATTASWTYPLQTGAGTNQVTIHLS